MLQDPNGRSIGYLRLSLTSACPMRCTYCRPEILENPTNELRLSLAEIAALVEHLVAAHGVRKVRLTGGEPTARPDHLAIIERLATIPGLDDLAMTTNGLTLVRHAAAYARAGLRRVNVSLDSLDRARFARLTGVDGLHRVLDGIDAALAAGLTPLRLNTVVVRNENDQELPELVRFAARKQVEIRFIELMPMGAVGARWGELFVPEMVMRQGLGGVIESWNAHAPAAASARRYEVVLTDGTRAIIGFITAMSCNFCAACNRIRVAADGTLYPCLMGLPAGTLLPALRPVLDRADLDRRLAEGLAVKAPEHGATGSVIMTRIGG